MKIKLDFYEVEVKARDNIRSPKMNEEDTMYFLNWLSLAFNYAARFEEGNGYHATANAYKEASDSIDEITLKYFRDKADE